MPTLRDKTREALARTEPDEREARRELGTILARVKRRERARTRLVFALAPVALVLGIAIFVLGRRREPVPPPVAALGGIHLHLHLAGEPPAKDITLDVSFKGDQ